MHEPDDSSDVVVDLAISDVRVSITGSAVTETAGFSAIHHLESFAAYAPDIQLDAVLADPSVVDDESALAQACRALGAELHVHRVGMSTLPTQHDRLRLAAALQDVLGSGSRPA